MDIYVSLEIREHTYVQYIYVTAAGTWNAYTWKTVVKRLVRGLIKSFRPTDNTLFD
jgi:hypothetical protein